LRPLLFRPELFFELLLRDDAPLRDALFREPPRFMELFFDAPPRFALARRFRPPPRFDALFFDDEAREPDPEPRALLLFRLDFRLEPDRFDDEPRPDDRFDAPDRFLDDFLPVAMCVLLCGRVCMNASQDSRTL
jgi:hypothetical protein